MVLNEQQLGCTDEREGSKKRRRREAEVEKEKKDQVL